MGVLDFIFGNSEDDLENTEPEHPLNRVPFFQRPMGASTNDPQVGEDDAGNPVFKTLTGNQYTVRVNPDQRTEGQKIKDAVIGGAEAVKEYAQNPTLPSTEQVVDFAKDSAVGAYNQLDDIMSGRGTMGDLFGMVGGIGAAPTVINKFVDIAPDGDASVIAGMFIPASMKSGNESLIDIADSLKLKGASRDEIWKQTGLWQIQEKGDWLSEIDDSGAEIALTLPFRKEPVPSKTETVTTTKRVQKGGNQLTSDEVLAAKINTQKQMLELRAQLQRKDISVEAATERANELQAQLNQILGKDKSDIEYEDITVTEEKPIKRKNLTAGFGPSAAYPYKPKSMLDEVLLHDEVMDVLRENQIDPSTISAEAGRRKSESAQAQRSSGLAYDREPSKYEKGFPSRISSFKNATSWMSNPRNKADQDVMDRYKSGEISKEQAEAEFILSTMLHEVQHLIDTDFKSRSGSGFNWTRSKERKNRYKEELKDLKSGNYDDVDGSFAARIDKLEKLVAMTDKELYYHDMGEAKSRLVQARRDMTADERREVPPYKMLDKEEALLFAGDRLSELDD